jgi:hypothetical protein
MLYRWSSCRLPLVEEEGEKHPIITLSLLLLLLPLGQETLKLKILYKYICIFYFSFESNKRTNIHLSLFFTTQLLGLSFVLDF